MKKDKEGATTQCMKQAVNNCKVSDTKKLHYIVVDIAVVLILQFKQVTP